MDNDTYLQLSDSNEFENFKEEKKQNIEKILGINVSSLCVVNSVIPKRKRQKIFKILDQGIFKDNIYFKSILTRERILKQICLSNSVYIEDSLFYFPPNIENLRLSRKNLYETNKITLIATVEVSDKYSSDKLKRINEKNGEINKLTSDIVILEEKINAYKQTQKTVPILKSGDDIFKLRNAGKVILQSPISTFTLNEQKWNCCYKDRKELNDKTIKLTIVPDKLNLRFKEDSRWFIRLWLEYPGEIFNKELIELSINRKFACENDKNNIEKMLSLSVLWVMVKVLLEII
jgi:hypothetical protein